MGACAMSAMLLSCDADRPAREQQEQAPAPSVSRLEGVEVPQFNSDSAYAYIEK